MKHKDSAYAAAGLISLVLLFWGQARQWILTAIATVLALLFPPILVFVCFWAIWKLLTGEVAKAYKLRMKEQPKPNQEPEPEPEPAE